MSKDDKWNTFDAILREETSSMKAQAESETSKEIAPVDTFSDALEKAKELIKISETTDVASLIQRMREQFVTNRLDTATKSEKAVNLTLTRLIDKLNSEEMPVNTLLKILTQLRESSEQDMTAILGVPNPNDKHPSGAVINILNTNNTSQSSEPNQQSAGTVSSPQGTTEASAEISKFLEVSTLALENIKNGTVNVSDEVKSKVLDAEYEEVENNESK